jgi:hypothetical protein
MSEPTEADREATADVTGKRTSQAAIDMLKPYFPLPWRVEEDWTAEIIAANGRLVVKMPYPHKLAEAYEIVSAVNAGAPGVAAEERERCAKIAESAFDRDPIDPSDAEADATWIAAKIRSGGP